MLSLLMFVCCCPVFVLFLFFVFFWGRGGGIKFFSVKDGRSKNVLTLGGRS